MSTGEDVLFWILAPLMVIAAMGLLFTRKAVHAAVAVVFVMISLAVLYIAQEAPFLGVVQIVVYTGAVMMLFLFVLMLVGVDASDSLVETIKGQRWIGALLGLGLVAIIVGVVVQVTFPPAVGLPADEQTNPVTLARILFSDYVFTFEVVGILLVTAAVAALVLTHRRRLEPHRGQKERADEKVARLPEGGRLVSLPAPGVYAQHNAMDVPALDAQGRPIPESISRVLRIRGQARSESSILESERDVMVEHMPDHSLLSVRADLPDTAGTDGAADAHPGPDARPDDGPPDDATPSGTESEDR
ncbi:NADH:ubiquinone oxidoreductase subunit J [Paraoerskovia sediminicola]|uniref:NADH-quinone oxidoreductase subunit J n=1 Tax=Paraoerskovia sediminicola TaxID=1138587 RepID=A0ABN6XCV5_9CELL|nr:NADH-quinone oxidoreductase subunit J [Paraoerskovia sediminicola]BDZ41273.1 NADH:ubiquinone oxidoreductase subunit J [Paraoerskovia sediminicola]